MIMMMMIVMMMMMMMMIRKGRFTEINNPYFTAAAQEKLIEKKRLEMTVNTNLTSILSCRCSH